MKYYIVKNSLEVTSHNRLYDQILKAHEEDDIEEIRRIAQNFGDINGDYTEFDTLEEAEEAAYDGYDFDHFSAHGNRFVNIKWFEIWSEDEEKEETTLIKYCI